MKNEERYDDLRLFVRTYIVEIKQHELLDLLSKLEKEGNFPPAKGIFHDMAIYANGEKLKPEHKELYDDICYHCI